MSTTSDPGAARVPSGMHSVWADDLFEHVGALAERAPNGADDVWPLELWMAREDALLDGDTWHAGRARRLRPLIAAILGR